MAERENTLPTKLSVKTGETDRKHIFQITESDKDKESICSGTIAEDIAEEETDDSDLGVGEILFGDCNEVSDVDKNM